METHDMLNFSGSASDMLAAMKAAGIVMPDAEEAALKVAAAPPSVLIAAASCGDPSCGVDHSHGGHDHGHDHGRVGDEMDCCAAPSHDQGHTHGHAHGEESCCTAPAAVAHDHGHGHDKIDSCTAAPASLAHNHGHSHAAAAASPLPPPPSPAAAPVSEVPEGVLLVDASETSLTLTWAAVPQAIKYELEWRASKGPAEEWAKLGSKGFAAPLPPKQKNGLAPGAAFDFRLRARDSVDWFPWSPVATHATLAAGAPRLPAVTLQKAEAGALTVAWTAVDPEDHPAAK